MNIVNIVNTVNSWLGPAHSLSPVELFSFRCAKPPHTPPLPLGRDSARNPRIQNMLRMIGFGENIGSGFPTIIKAWHEASWQLPDLREEPDLRLVELKLWTASLVSKKTNEELKLLFGSSFALLTTDEKMVLATAMEEGSVTNARMQTLLKTNSLEISKLLVHLVALGMLVHSNKGRWTHYIPNRDFIPTNDRIENDRIENDRIENDRIENVDRETKLYNRRKAIIRAIKANRSILAEKIAARLQCSVTTINRDFAFLRNNGYICRVGGKRHGYWIVTKEFVD